MRFGPIFMAFMALVSATLYAQTAKEAALLERIKPVGQVHIEGELITLPATTSSTPRSPEALYQSHCQVCHQSGAAGAPILGKKAAWTARVAQGVEVLYQHAIGGYNAMPAKGGCINCSDEEIKSVVDYILANSQ